ncbi:hypothetical protein PORCRE_976 [Porphyromonas crevioricanis JCM 15906]|uniref:Uncharacterized protein n=1 Tax=Porphyromonas crevioricanis JCM 15906 TaxID=1305617 RepID=T1CHD1_9PORP|nr:hypothetical protein PORCRE_976 [Porphyromonas crevioricanis JCM 15906]
MEVRRGGGRCFPIDFPLSVSPCLFRACEIEAISLLQVGLRSVISSHRIWRAARMFVSLREI